MFLDGCRIGKYSLLCPENRFQANFFTLPQLGNWIDNLTYTWYIVTERPSWRPNFFLCWHLVSITIPENPLR